MQLGASMTAQIVDRIYECSMLPDLWPEVLAELSMIGGARGGVIFVANNDGILRWSASAQIFEDMADYVSGGWLGRDLRQRRLLNARHAGFLTDENLFSAGEIENDPTIRDYYRARGLGWTAITGVQLPTGDLAVMTVEREYANGPVPPHSIRQLDELRPHLARSALMSARLQMERARVATDSLALVGLPALVFNSAGMVLAMNSLIEAESTHVRWRMRDRFSLKDSAADLLLRQAIETIGIEEASPARSFAVRDEDGVAALVAHVIPMRRSARDLFTHAAGVLVLTPLTLPHAPPVELVQSLFDLTPAEARVARCLVAGDTVEHIAAMGHISANTVRTQVRRVLEKTGCSRQVEVVALLSGISIPPR